MKAAPSVQSYGPLLGRLDTLRPQVRIVGGGISGLLAAYFLQQTGYKVKLYEARGQLGGLIESPAALWGRFERAAHSLRASAPLLDLFDALGLDRTHARNTRKFIWVEGRGMRRFPLAAYELPPLLARAIFRHSRPSHPETSVAAWALHHLGAAALNRLIHPVCQGIYATPPQKLNLALAFPQLVPRDRRPLLGQLVSRMRATWRVRRELKVRLAGRSAIFAPTGGMEKLIHALAEAVAAKGAEVVCNHRVSAAELASWIDRDNVVLALAAPEAAALLAPHPVYSPLAACCERVRYVPLVVASVFLHRAEHRPPDGLGVLCAAGSRRHCLGILFNSSPFEGCSFDEETVAAYSVMLGGLGREQLLSCSDDQLLGYVVEDLEVMLGLRATPLGVELTRWPAALPLYDAALGHTLTRLRQLAEGLPPGMALAGNYLSTISIRGMVEQWSGLAHPK